MSDTVTIQPGATGADFVTLTDDIGQWLTNHNARFVIRYSVPPESTSIGKDIHDDEIAWHHTHNIAVLLNWEINTRDGFRGRPGGLNAGQWLKNRAHQLGYPETVPLFVSIDTNTTDRNVGIFERYVRGFAETVAPHPLGIYGDDDIATAVWDLRPIYWKTNARAWSSRPGPPAHIQQHLPEPPSVDRNTCVRAFDGWLPTSEDDEMAIRYFRFEPLEVTGPVPLFATSDGLHVSWVSAPQFAAVGAGADIEVVDRAEAIRYTFVGPTPPGYFGIWGSDAH
jgi:hypothetical protein